MRDTDVLCMHCHQYVSRTRERAHRRLQIAPLYSPTHRIPSRLRRVFDIEEPEEREVAADRHDVVSGLGIEDCESHAPAILAVENLICDRWNRDISNVNSESDDDEVDEPSAMIDSNSEDDFEELLEGGLSAWDQLGEGYERDAAAVGELPKKWTNAPLSMIPLPS